MVGIHVRWTLHRLSSMSLCSLVSYSFHLHTLDAGSWPVATGFQWQPLLQRIHMVTRRKQCIVIPQMLTIPTWHTSRAHPFLSVQIPYFRQIATFVICSGLIGIDTRATCLRQSFRLLMSPRFPHLLHGF